MKTKYIFIHCDSVLQADTVIYEVWIGHSKQDKRDLAFFESLAKSSDFYFKPYDVEVCNFLERIHQSVCESCRNSLEVPPRRQVMAAELRRLIKRGMVCAKQFTPGFLAMRRQLTPEFSNLKIASYGK